MVDDLDIFRAAKVLIEHHGERARLEAIDRLEQFRAADNEQAVALWYRIADAIQSIQLKEAPKDKRKH